MYLLFYFFILVDVMLSVYYNGYVGMNFSIFDMDNDGEFYMNCVFDNFGGWWFSECY